MAVVDVTFPGNLAQVKTAADLRGIPTSVMPSGALYLCVDLTGLFSYAAGSLSVDDGVTVIKPDDKSPLQAGRWIKKADGLAPGPPGTANNTYTSYTALQASDPTRKYAYLSGDTDTPPHPDGPYSNTAGMVGQWKPQPAAGIAYSGTNVGRFLDVQPREVVDQPPIPRGLLTSSSSVLMLMDSLGEATGAPSYNKGYSYLTARSILNANDLGYDQNAGFGYHSIVNMENAVAEAGAALGGGGAFLDAGVVHSRLRLTSGGYIEITGRQLASIDVVYDGSASTGSLTFALNGTTVATKAVSGTGLQNTFQTQLAGGANILTTDVIRITSTGGTVVITELLPLRQVSNVPLVHVAAKSGSAYQDYTSSAALDELAYYLNLFRAGSPKVFYMGLGTNNIYSGGKALSPSDTVAQMTALVAGINARCTDVQFLVQIPHKANEALFPVVLPSYAHQDYVDAILAFARAGRYGTVRQDLVDYSSRFADGIHWDAAGHLGAASNATRSVGVSYNAAVKTLPPTSASGPAFATPTLGTGWTKFNDITATVRKNGNTVALAGILSPGTSTTAATLPAGYAPTGRTVFMTGRSDAGAATFKIDTTGALILDTIPASFFSLEGITFQLNQ